MKNKKILVLIAVTLTLGVLLVVLEKTHITNFIKLHPVSTPTSQGPTPEQKRQDDSTNAAAKKQLIEKSSPETTPNQAPAPTSDNIDLSARQEANNTVTVFTKLKNTSSGNCSLTITNGSKTTTQAASVYYQPEYSSCAGFSVPINTVGSGTWSITLTVTANGTSANKTISLGVN